MAPINDVEDTDAQDHDPRDLARLLVSTLGLSDPANTVSSGSGKRPEMALLLVAQAYAAWLQSGLGYTARAGMSWVGYGALLAQQLGAVVSGRQDQDSAMRILLDETAAQLREVGELSMQEARVLQDNLRQLREKLRELEDGAHDEPHRYAKAKR